MGSSNEAAYYKNVPVASGKALVFIGDSTLDNITWVGRYENCIKAKAQGLLPDVKVYNFAADGFTSSEVWGGSIPSISYSMRKTVDPFPTASACSKLHPLDELKKIPEPVKFVVLSVGGNDLRTILSSPTQIASESKVALICQGCISATGGFESIQGEVQSYFMEFINEIRGMYKRQEVSDQDQFQVLRM